jgi:hypothetical protein
MAKGLSLYGSVYYDMIIIEKLLTAMLVEYEGWYGKEASLDLAP